MAEGGASENPGAGRQHEADGDDPVSSKQRLRRGKDDAIGQAGRLGGVRGETGSGVRGYEPCAV